MVCSITLQDVQQLTICEVAVTTLIKQTNNIAKQFKKPDLKRALMRCILQGSLCIWTQLPFALPPVCLIPCWMLALLIPICITADHLYEHVCRCCFRRQLEADNATVRTLPRLFSETRFGAYVLQMLDIMAVYPWLRRTIMTDEEIFTVKYIDNKDVQVCAQHCKSRAAVHQHCSPRSHVTTENSLTETVHVGCIQDHPAK